MSYHYAFDAAHLLEECIEEILQLIECDESGRRPLSSSNASLYDMKESLATVEVHLFHYFLQMIEKEIQQSSPSQKQVYHHHPCVDLKSAMDFLQELVCEKKTALLRNNNASSSKHQKANLHTYYPSRSVSDSLLFRLHVALQLCRVRIDDARLVIIGGRKKRQQHLRISPSSSNDESSYNNPTPYNNNRFRWKRLVVRTLHTTTALLTLGSCSLLAYPRCKWTSRRIGAGMLVVNVPYYRSILFPLTQAALGIVATRWLSITWGKLWTSIKLCKSAEAIEEWSRQWSLITQASNKPSRIVSSVPPQVKATHTKGQECPDDTSSSVDSTRNRRLIEYALHDTTKTSFWQSQGELRFWMIKRAMDVFYASVGTAIGITRTTGEKPTETNWQVPLVTAAAASFYSVTGARDRAAAVTSSSATSKSLIQNAWGMVSLPAVKNLSLQASRLLKGAAVADRIEICGVSCFVLSREPAPELAAAIKRNRRMHQRRKPIATLSTIDEQEEHTPDSQRSLRPFARSASTTRYRQRDVIFHLTGGGFFAHIIASDLPYLLDWSAKTCAVVICPEYALLPEHTFPHALNQVENVYRALTSDSSAVHTLGFETNRIVVTGESAGGNLAAALCVKLATDPERDAVAIPAVTQKQHRTTASESPNKMPDALMLSCPVLNLSLEVSHSRVVGTEDPVLPSGLLSAISDAYLPPELGISKKEPLASPLYASDAVLSLFPPTLLFASSNDPVLDDSVVFNQRLRSLGVASDLFAAQNMPHAYLGLGTAGFPEAQQVQERCETWLVHQLTRDLQEKTEPCHHDDNQEKRSYRR